LWGEARGNSTTENSEKRKKRQAATQHQVSKTNLSFLEKWNYGKIGFIGNGLVFKKKSATGGGWGKTKAEANLLLIETGGGKKKRRKS